MAKTIIVIMRMMKKQEISILYPEITLILSINNK